MPTSYPKSSDVVADTTATAAAVNAIRADAVESRIVSLTAGENLTALDAVYVKAADGKAYKAKAASGATSYFFGFATATVTTGNTASIVCFGYLDGFSGLTTGSIYYTSSATFGAIDTAYTNDFVSIVGIAVSTTTLLVMPHNWPNYNPGAFTAATSLSSSGDITSTAGNIKGIGALIGDGSAGTPALRFTSDTNTGIYRIGTDNIGIALGGSKVVDIASGTSSFSSSLSCSGSLQAGTYLGIGGASDNSAAVYIAHTPTGTTQYSIRGLNTLAGTTANAALLTDTTISNTCTTVYDHYSSVAVANTKTVTQRFFLYAQNNTGSGAVTTSFFAHVASDFLEGGTTHDTEADEIRIQTAAGTRYLKVYS